MRKKVLFIYSIFLVVFITCYANAQPILQESFDYPAGDNLTNNGWVRHGGFFNPITLTNGGLTYPGYFATGNAVDVTIFSCSVATAAARLSSAFALATLRSASA